MKDAWIIVKNAKSGKREYLCSVIFAYPISKEFFQWIPEEKSGLLKASRFSSDEEAHYWVQYFKENDPDATYSIRKIAIKE